ncbi:MAG: hypothetical protein WAU36_01445, partial [Cyclobacteriaceae bacterium]
MKTCKLVLTTILFTLSIALLQAQGWIGKYDDLASNPLIDTRSIGSNRYIISNQRLLVTDSMGQITLDKHLYPSIESGIIRDSDFVIVLNGSIFSFDFSGEKIWEYSLEYNSLDVLPDDIIINGLNEIAILTTESGGTGPLQPSRLVFEKRAADGVQLLKKYITPNSPMPWYKSSKFLALANGGYISIGQKMDDTGFDGLYVMRLDENGDILWEKTLPSSELFYGFAPNIFETSEHELVLIGCYFDFINLSFNKLKVIKLNEMGEAEWNNEVDVEFSTFTIPQDIIAMPSGNLLVSLSGLDESQPNLVYQRSELMMLNKDGSLLWRNHLDYFPSLLEDVNIKKIEYLGGNNLLLAGEYSINQTASSLILVMADTFGNLYPHFVQGNIFYDLNLDCQNQLDEPSFDKYLVSIQSSSDIFYTNSDLHGNYRMNLPAGEFNISIGLNEYWTSCQTSQTVTLNTTTDTAVVDFALQPLFNCPLLDVSISTPFLRLCFDGNYYVNYCNNGTIPAENATVQVTLADELSYLNATAPLLSQNGQVLTFDIGTVGVNECGNFRLDFSMLCDSSLFGQTLCTEAHIFPDELCGDDPFNGPI